MPLFYCCLRKLDSENPKRCLKRLDGSEKRKLGMGSFRESFDTYLPEDNWDFDENDKICNKCSIKVRQNIFSLLCMNALYYFRFGNVIRNFGLSRKGVSVPFQIRQES
jgi:hypothetical protein